MMCHIHRLNSNASNYAKYNVLTRGYMSSISSLLTTCSDMLK